MRTIDPLSCIMSMRHALHGEKRFPPGSIGFGSLAHCVCIFYLANQHLRLGFPRRLKDMAGSSFAVLLCCVWIHVPNDFQSILDMIRARCCACIGCSYSKWQRPFLAGAAHANGRRGCRGCGPNLNKHTSCQLAFQILFSSFFQMRAVVLKFRMCEAMLPEVSEVST